MGRPPGARNKPKVATMTIESGTMRVGAEEPDNPFEPIRAVPPKPVKPKPQPGPVPEPAVAKAKKPVKIDQEMLDAFDRQSMLDEEGDILYIPPEIVPEGMRYNWKTFTVLGQQQARRFGRFEATGWSPVPAERHPGLFTPKGYKGMIEYDGLVLMEKPEELCLRAEAREFMKARGQVMGKEAQIRGGDVDGVSFDTKHKSAQRVNRVSKSFEPFRVPEE